MRFSSAHVAARLSGNRLGSKKAATFNKNGNWPINKHANCAAQDTLRAADRHFCGINTSFFYPERDFRHAKHEIGHADHDFRYAEREIRYANHDVRYAEREIRYAKHDFRYAEHEIRYADHDFRYAGNDIRYANRVFFCSKRDWRGCRHDENGPRDVMQRCCAQEVDCRTSQKGRRRGEAIPRE